MSLLSVERLMNTITLKPVDKESAGFLSALGMAITWWCKSTTRSVVGSVS